MREPLPVEMSGAARLFGIAMDDFAATTVATQYEKLDEEFMRHYEHASGRVDLIIGFIDVEVGQTAHTLAVC